LQEPANLPVVDGIGKVIGPSRCGKIIEDLHIHLIVATHTSLLLRYPMATIKFKTLDKDLIHSSPQIRKIRKLLVPAALLRGPGLRGLR
jgi:hypothetical protein